ncbi:39S ribosomal protein L47, mitochondrial [Bulinus truncatus]|nr:39S ribosomal protein L47, mitochondrial [Bulinus truncatus]
MAALSQHFKRVLNVILNKPLSAPFICSAGRNIINGNVSSISTVSRQTQSVLLKPALCSTNTVTCNNHFHSSVPNNDLMEFFDRKEVWGESSVPSGRPYRLDELRVKSNQDLHKLWYVLLKERNMLLTMETEYNRNNELFPNPERITKVEESMENILEVVKERNNAVSLLETGKSAELGGTYVRDFLGRVVWRKFQEYAVPPHMNKAFRLLYPRGFKRLHLKYLPLWRQKIAKFRWYHYHRQVNENKALVKKFPHLEGKLHVPLPKEPEVY